MLFKIIIKIIYIIFIIYIIYFLNMLKIIILFYSITLISFIFEFNKKVNCKKYSLIKPPKIYNNDNIIVLFGKFIEARYFIILYMIIFRYKKMGTYNIKYKDLILTFCIVYFHIPYRLIKIIWIYIYSPDISFKIAMYKYIYKMNVNIENKVIEIYNYNTYLNPGLSNSVKIFLKFCVENKIPIEKYETVSDVKRIFKFMDLQFDTTPTKYFKYIKFVDFKYGLFHPGGNLKEFEIDTNIIATSYVKPNVPTRDIITSPKELITNYAKNPGIILKDEKIYKEDSKVIKSKIGEIALCIHNKKNEEYPREDIIKSVIPKQCKDVIESLERGISVFLSKYDIVDKDNKLRVKILNNISNYNLRYDFLIENYDEIISSAIEIKENL